MPTFNFNLRNPQANHPTPVYLVIRYQKYRLVYPSGEKISPSSWNNKTQRQKILFTQSELVSNDLSREQKREYYVAKSFNARLILIQHIAERVFDNYVKQNEGEEPEPKEYRLLFEVELEKIRFARKDLFTFMRSYIDDKKQQFNEADTDRKRGASFRSYEQLYSHLRDYTEYTGADVDFRDIDTEFYYSFADFLRNKKNLLPNTIGKHIKSLKSILNSATDNGINTNLIYKSRFFKVITEKVSSLSLSDLELSQLYRIDLSDNELYDQVRDIFLVCAYTGLKYTELDRIRSIDVAKLRIVISDLQRTGEYVLRLNPELVAILNKYDWQNENFKLPVLSNVLMNEHIKKICSRIPQLQEFTNYDLLSKKKGERHTRSNVAKYELVTMQTARRSFHINQYKSGVDIYLLMIISGHKTQDNYLNYIDVTPQEHVANLQKRLEENQKLNFL